MNLHFFDYDSKVARPSGSGGRSGIISLELITFNSVSLFSHAFGRIRSKCNLKTSSITTHTTDLPTAFFVYLDPGRALY